MEDVVCGGCSAWKMLCAEDAVCGALPGDRVPEALLGWGLMFELACAILGVLKYSHLSRLLGVCEAAPGQKTSQPCTTQQVDLSLRGRRENAGAVFPLLVLLFPCSGTTWHGWGLSPWALREAAEQRS